MLGLFKKEEVPVFDHYDFNTLFKSLNIEQVDIHYWKKTFTKDFYWWGNVAYKMGDLKGEKRFEAETLSELLEQIEQFGKATG